MKIMIAVPCMDTVPVQFCQSLALLHKVGECTLAMNPGSLVHTSRNDLAVRAIKMEADYVFWMDSDMIFPQDTLVRMVDTLKKNDIDILTGLYFRRKPPYSPVLFNRLDMKKDGVCSWTEFETIPDHLFEVGGCGFGCVLMSTEVFLSVQSEHGYMFTPIGNNGEDVAFCVRARQCGYKIWCDPSIVCGHIGQTVINDEFYTAYKAAQKKE